MKRGINIRIGDCRALCECGESKTLVDGGGKETVILPGLIGKPKESEEEERANDGTPSIYLKPSDIMLAENLRRDLEDTGVPPVGVGPGDPWKNVNRGIRDESPSGQWDGNGEINGGQNDETPVAVESHHASGGDKILELLSPLHEGTDGEDWK